MNTLSRSIHRNGQRLRTLMAISCGSLAGLLLSGCDVFDDDDDDVPIVDTTPHRPEPYTLPSELVHTVGDPAAGQDVFRFETFGNETFWTDAMQLPQGLVAAGVTPLAALQLGLSVNAAALHPDTAAAAVAAIDDIEGGTAPEDTIFGDPAITVALINQNAVAGVVAFDETGTRKLLGSDAAFDPNDTLDIAGGDKVGLTCAVCHARTDESVLAPSEALGTRGSIGVQVDGPSAHGLDVGAILAAAANSLAYYPMLQLQFDALSGATIGRGDFAGLAVSDAEAADPDSIDVMQLEAQADAYLSGNASGGQRHYPVGQFDAFPDGIGNPLHIAAFFATEQGAPWGIDGGVALLEDFNNTVYTVSLDPTSMATPSGQAFLEALAGGVGTEISQDYRAVLEATGVDLDDIPYVVANGGLSPGDAASVAGRRVDDAALLNLNAYTDSLPSPRASDDIDQTLADQGREVFMTLAPNGGDCTTCHQVSPDKFVNPDTLPFADVYPAYEDSLQMIQERTDLAPIQNSGGPTNTEGPNPFIDDRMIVIDGSRREEDKGISFPLLMDLERRDALLHDDSVQAMSFADAASLLLDPSRGDDAAHPFYIEDENDRVAVVEFLRSRETVEDPELDDSQTDLGQ